MSIQDIIRANAARRVKAKKRKALAPVQAVMDKVNEPNLKGVDFASNRAEELAEEAGLSWQDFVGVKCSGCAGFTAQDVRTVIEGR